MTERPIIFSGDMMRAILDGCKTQTRRVIKPQPRYTPNDCWTFYGKGTKVNFTPTVSEYAKEQMEEILTFCPYGIPGDRLWVRETWAEIKSNGEILYKAHRHYKHNSELAQLALGFKWKSPLFMPRWASRILLTIKSVRVERVQDIKGDDLYAEGISMNGALAEFIGLWNSLNAKRGYGWNENPWVWVIEFERSVK